MNAKRKINKNHIKYEEYISKCREIAEAEWAEINAVRKNSILQLDGPEGAILRKYLNMVKLLKEEYSFYLKKINNHNQKHCKLRGVE